MIAGSENWLMAFAYASDFASFPGTKLTATDRKWVPGIICGKDIKSVPRTVGRSTAYYYANNANPAGVVLGKAPVDGAFAFTGVIIDGTLPYGCLGKATADTPSSNIWQIQGSTDGSVPKLIAIVENNQLYANQARQFEDVRFIKSDICGVPFKTPDGEIGMFLAMDVAGIARKEYTGTARNTYDVNYRGEHAPDMGYNIFGNNFTAFEWKWSYDGGSNYLTGTNYICGLKSSITSSIGNVLRMDNNLFAGMQSVGGRHKYGKPVFKFLQYMNAAGHLDDFETYRFDKDSTQPSTYKGDIIMTVPRRHENDYMQVTWKNVYLLDVQHEPTPADVEGEKFTLLTFSEPTDIIFNSRCVTSAGGVEPEHDADYEKA